MKPFLLFSFLTCFVFTYAQPVKIRFEHLNARTGLPSDYVGQVLQDDNGYIWIATLNELSKFDGYRLKVYHHFVKEGDKAQNAYVSGIFYDHQKRLWISTIGGSLFLYDAPRDTVKLICYNPAKASGSEYYTHFIVDKFNGVWGATQSENGEYGLYYYDPVTKKSRHFSVHQNGADHINNVNVGPVVTKTGNLLIGTDDGLYQYNYQSKRFTSCFDPSDSLKRFKISNLYEAPSAPGTLWMLAAHGHDNQYHLYRFNERDKKLISCLNLNGEVKNSASYIYEDHQKRLWLASSRGLFLFDRRTKTTTDYLYPANDKYFKEQSLVQILEDRKGVLWLGTNFGLVAFNPATGRFQRYVANASNPDALAHNHITQLFEDKSGVLWIGMDEYGIDHINPLSSAFTSFKFNSGQAGSYPENVMGLTPGFNGNYFVNTQRGIYEWDVKGNRFNKLKHGKGNDVNFILSASLSTDGGLYYISGDWLTRKTTLNIFYRNGADKSFVLPGKEMAIKLLQDHSFHFWVLSLRGKLYEFHPESHSFERYPFAVAPGSNKVKIDTIDNTVYQTFFEDRQRTVWIANPQTGLTRIDRINKKLTVFPLLQTGVFKDINAMFEDKSGNFWLGTRAEGLWLFDPKANKLIKRITDHEGLLNNAIKGIAEDELGNLWICSDRGLVKYDSRTGNLQSYTTANNIPLEVPVKMANAPNGQLFLVMFNSLLIFNPGDIQRNQVSPFVHIESIRYSNSEGSASHDVKIFNRSGISLPYDQNRITFNYVGLHFAHSSQNQYRYRLLGYDKGWVNAATQRSVTYNNLSPGVYTFNVIAANSDGVWNKKGDSFTIIIHSPWWSTWWAWLIYVVFFIAAIYAFISFRSKHLMRENQVLEEKVNLRTKQLSEANKELNEQQEEITTQRDRLSETVNHLKQTQTQLIQSEKMASLGELTAGIAHEIQNPLNFVNNFSEVNKEMIDELKEELKNGNVDEALVIADDIQQNEEKINHHGKRADNIVKGMLQHSQSSSGKKEPVNINVLADEYLRLSYHGLRAKDKTFNAELVTNFDTSLPKVNIIPQDMGRVLLNLFNNAFYAVNQKRKAGGEDYKPEVTIATYVENGQVIIKVKDNGIGIPDAIKDKIMQPFFTTKPTGEGTGLGLSLSYDIVVKGHGGSINVESKEGEGTMFIISLPF
ncbi:MAG: hypothetical protein JWQ63_2981 [Mucilaginibacter sp.]|nr:hypothetical protein [Mucilaginibacter sp.]